jgi:hypothetical protein
MKKVLCMLFTIILVFASVGCASVINTETKVVEATIVDVDRDPVRYVGNTPMPADYDILLRYEDVETWIDVSRSEYNKYKDLVGTTITVNLVITYYNDNTIKRHLVLMEE